MTKYCITAESSSDEERDLKDEFKTYEWVLNAEKKWVWRGPKWRNSFEISDLLKAGDTVLTAKETGNSITTGAPVEIELRIARNETKYPISEMPSE